MTALSRQSYHILLALAGEDLHGSGIARAVREETDGRLKLWPATLYGTLEDLSREGLIDELDFDERPTGASEKRRYYRITKHGQRILALETERLARHVRRAQKHLRRLRSEGS